MTAHSSVLVLQAVGVVGPYPERELVLPEGDYGERYVLSVFNPPYVRLVISRAPTLRVSR